MAKSIRNVRPAWADLKVDNTGNDPAPVRGTGPKARTGSLSVDFLTRKEGSAVGIFRVDAIGSADGASVLWRITDTETGAVILERKVAQ